MISTRIENNRDMLSAKTGQKIFTRRALLVLGLTGIGYILLVVRLFYLQIIKGGHYQTLSRNNRISVRFLGSERGLLKDIKGRIIARSRTSFRAYIVPEETPSVSSTLDLLGRVVRIRNRAEVLDKADKQLPFQPILVSEGLSWEQVESIALNTPDLSSVRLQKDYHRIYPTGASLSHISGYLGASGNVQEVRRLPRRRVGIAGIEKYYEEKLRGKIGRVELEVTASGRVVREVSRIASKRGDDLRLNIDLGLQTYIYRRLRHYKAASAIVMDIFTGGILAMVSVPSYDPNQFQEGLSQEKWEKIRSRDLSPLTNRCISSTYAPGSTFKIASALAARSHGLESTTKYHCPGYLDIGGDRFHCWKRSGHGSINMRQALAQSCDVWFYNMMLEVGINKVNHIARKLGLGILSDIDLNGEKSGLLPNRAWKKKVLKESWYTGDSLVAAIGQGYVLSTPLQLVRMLSVIVNGGLLVRPRLLSEEGVAEAVSAEIPPADIKFMRHALRDVVNSHLGTAYRTRITIPNYAMGGKTGTSQVSRFRERADNQETPWRLRDHSIFAGYAPLHSPSLACCCLVEHGGSSLRVAAPLARDILLAAQTQPAGPQVNSFQL